MRDFIETKQKPDVGLVENQLTAEQRLAGNAVRLYNDAALLHRSSRYPSAVALAILAIEEVGKLRVTQAKRLFPDINPKARSRVHHDKQSAFLLEHRNRAYNEALSEVCKNVAGERDWSNACGDSDWDKTQNFLFEGWLNFYASKTVSSREHIADVFNSITEAVERKVYDHPFGYLHEIAEDKLIDKQRQNAFFLDLDRMGEVESDPADLGDGDAGFWMSVAEIAVEGLYSEERSMVAVRQFLARFAFDHNREPFKPNQPMTVAEFTKAFAEVAKKAISGSVEQTSQT